MDEYTQNQIKLKNINTLDKTWVLDIETDSKISKIATYISCMAIKNVGTGKHYTFVKKGSYKGFKDIEYGVKYIKHLLDTGNTIVAHNIQYDMGVFELLYNFPILDYFKQMEDTMQISQLVYPSWILKEHKLSKNLQYKGVQPNSHSLKAWGLRLSKDKHKLDVEEEGIEYHIITEKLLKYLHRDIDITIMLYKYLIKQSKFPKKKIRQLELYNTLVASYYSNYGFYIDTNQKEKLIKSYERTIKQIDLQLAGSFVPYYKAKPIYKVQNQLLELYENSSYKGDYCTFVKGLIEDYNTFKMYITGKCRIALDKSLNTEYSFLDILVNVKIAKKDKKTGTYTLYTRNTLKWLEIDLYSINKEIRDTLVSPLNYYKNGKPKKSKNYNIKYENGILYRKVDCIIYPLKTDIKLEEFNPNSRYSIGNFFKRKYNHEFTILSESWNPVLNEDVMKSLPYPEASLLAKRFKANKDLSMIKGIENNMIGNYAYSRINVLGADSTTRSSASGAITKGFNVQQMSSDKEFRKMFSVPKGKKFITADLSSAELMLQSIILSPHDNGEFTKILLEGDKSKGTDMHSINGKNMSIPRKDAKVVWYASSYGASGLLIAYNLNKNPNDINEFLEEEVTMEYLRMKKRAEEYLGVLYYPLKKGMKVPLTKNLAKLSLWGNQLKKKLTDNLKGYNELQESLKKSVDKYGGIYALDGRLILVDSLHKVQNYKLQPDNAVLTKYWIFFVYELIRKKYPINKQWRPLVVVHDEINLECDDNEEIINYITKCIRNGLRMANEYLKLPINIDCDIAVGNDWSLH